MSAYIFIGPEEGRKQEAVDKVVSLFKSAQQAEEYVLYADETPASAIIETLQNQGLFAEARIVIVKNAEAIKKKEDVEKIVSWTLSSDNSSALILLSDEIKLAAEFDKAKVNKQVFYELSENEKISWVRDFFKHEGFSIDGDSIDTILEMVENNTDALKRECSLLVNFLPKGKPVNSEDIEKWLSHNREESPFTLFSRIAAGDLARSLESMSIMLAAKKKASEIMASLAWCFRRLSDYLMLAESGGANNYAELKKIGLSSPKTKSDCIAAARRYDSDAVEACLALTAQYDILMRSPSADLESVLMDRYILAIVNAGN